MEAMDYVDKYDKIMRKLWKRVGAIDEEKYPDRSVRIAQRYMKAAHNARIALHKYVKPTLDGYKLRGK